MQNPLLTTTIATGEGLPGEVAGVLLAQEIPLDPIARLRLIAMRSLGADVAGLVLVPDSGSTADARR